MEGYQTNPSFSIMKMDAFYRFQELVVEQGFRIRNQNESVAEYTRNYYDCLDRDFEHVSKEDRALTLSLSETVRWWTKAADISDAVLQELGEKEVMIEAFDKVQKLFKGREWLQQGRGLYPYNDDRYKEEVKYMWEEFKEIKSHTWENIKTKTFEYREKIIADFKDKRTGFLRQDESCHWYIVPADEIEDFDRLNKLVSEDFKDTDEWYELLDEFNEKYSQYMTSGGIGNVKVLIEKT